MSILILTLIFKVSDVWTLLVLSVTYKSHQLREKGHKAILDGGVMFSDLSNGAVKSVIPFHSPCQTIQGFPYGVQLGIGPDPVMLHHPTHHQLHPFRHEFLLSFQGGISRINEFIKIQGCVPGPMLDQEMIENYIKDDTCKAPSLGTESLSQFTDQGMGVSKSIDPLMKLYACLDLLGQSFPIHIPEKISHDIPQSGRINSRRQIEVGQIVHGPILN